MKSVYYVGLQVPMDPRHHLKGILLLLRLPLTCRTSRTLLKNGGSQLQSPSFWGDEVAGTPALWLFL